MVELGSSPYLNHFTQPDSIVPDPSNPQDWNRYSYARNNPIRYNDPTGHKVSYADNGALTDEETKYLVEKKFGAKVKGKWSQKELTTLYNTLDATLNKFDDNLKAFRNAFGPLTFNLLSDEAAWAAMTNDTMAKRNVFGTILLRHNTFEWGENNFGAGGWAIAHEMGHILDMKIANGDPNSFFSNAFIAVLNEMGACKHIGANGCLGTNPDPIYLIQNWGQGKGEYDPSGRSHPYGGSTSSTEDYAQSFAAFVLNDPFDVMGPERETIIQINIAVIVSYSQ